MSQSQTTMDAALFQLSQFAVAAASYSMQNNAATSALVPSREIAARWPKVIAPLLPAV